MMPDSSCANSRRSFNRSPNPARVHAIAANHFKENSAHHEAAQGKPRGPELRSQKNEICLQEARPSPITALSADTNVGLGENQRVGQRSKVEFLQNTGASPRFCGLFAPSQPAMPQVPRKIPVNASCPRFPHLVTPHSLTLESLKVSTVSSNAHN
ncbi:uncharacterized protein BJX67DRAFT_300584 [Aspergillus lucknowensis]|uniref:Uncharacterized protein n=1 Tax=Aspergillus lucknowensis TaxID=176173 RepID=A0ABR4LZK4_9EURO